MHGGVDVRVWSHRASYPTNIGPATIGPSSLRTGPPPGKPKSRPKSAFKRASRMPAIPTGRPAGNCAVAVAERRDPASELLDFYFLSTFIHESGRIKSKTVRFGRLTFGRGPFHGRTAVAAVLRCTTRRTISFLSFACSPTLAGSSTGKILSTVEATSSSS